MCAVVGTAVGYIIVRRPGRLGGLLDGVVMFSYAVPGIVLGVGLIVTYNEPPIILTGTSAILILAFFIRRLPFLGPLFSQHAAAACARHRGRVDQSGGRPRPHVPQDHRAAAVDGDPLGVLLALVEHDPRTQRHADPAIGQYGHALGVEIFNEVVNANFGLASALGTVLILLTFLPLVVLFTFLGKREEALV